MSDYIPSFKPGNAVTFTAGDAVIGGRLVTVTGDRTVEPAAADSTAVIGVAGFDVAAGERVTVFARPGGVHGLTAAAAITAGALVAPAADGKIQTAAEGVTPIGIALAAASAADDVIDVAFI